MGCIGVWANAMASTTPKSLRRNEHAAPRLVACAAALLVALCCAGSARAEDSRRASAELTVTAVVASTCSVNAARVSVDADGAVDAQATADAVALRCAAGVQPHTQVGYEVVSGAASGSDEHLVVTVA